MKKMKKKHRSIPAWILTALLLCACFPASSQEPAIHAMGNGKMCVYGQGADIHTVYPAPFSTPSLFRLVMDADHECRSNREPGTAIWTHEIARNGITAARLHDFVDLELPVLIRKMEVNQDIAFRLLLHPTLEVLALRQDDRDEKGEMLLMAPAGTVIYQKYVYPRPLFHLINWKGPLRLVPAEDSPNTYRLKCSPGTLELLFTGGPGYDEAVTHQELALELGYAKMYGRTRDGWMDFTSSRTDFREVLPDDLPLREKLLQTIDDVSVMIKAQQAETGAVMAGYPYPLGYVRDQYGVSRGLLALGYHEEARMILDFYWDVWERSGKLHCAQGIGVDGIFHIHENDEVESPGYLIMQAFDLLEKTGDKGYIEHIFPMLEWCWEVQQKHLAGQMLPFNGDETYVAGGILPRSTLNDGSAEATLLFIEGGIKLLKWIGEHERWSRDRMERERGLLEQVRQQYRENFWIDGSLATNNPARLDHTEPPRFRHGVCERGGSDCLVFRTDGFGGIDWTERDENGRYQCPTCLALGPMPRADSRIYHLISVSLIPLYFHSGLLSVSELQPMMRQVWKNYRETGVVSSRTRKSNLEDNRRSVGYDYGLILYAMLRTGTGEPEDLYRETLSIVDETGAWSEYYLDGIPSGTRCRPWESAINLEALIHFALNRSKRIP
jgi:hypothetical protein